MLKVKIEKGRSQQGGSHYKDKKKSLFKYKCHKMFQM